MDFQPYWLEGLPFKECYCAYADKYSFMVAKHDDGFWHLSWQDQEKGGSASNTIEGPFKTRAQAETRCRHIFKELKRKN